MNFRYIETVVTFYGVIMLLIEPSFLNRWALSATPLTEWSNASSLSILVAFILAAIDFYFHRDDDATQS